MFLVLTHKALDTVDVGIPHSLPIARTHLQHIVWPQKHMLVDPESSSLALCDKQGSEEIVAAAVIRENTA